MDAIALSLRMKRLTRTLPARHACPQTLRWSASNCYLTIDATRQGELASFNFNRIHLCGFEADAASVAHWIDLFTHGDGARLARSARAVARVTRAEILAVRDSLGESLWPGYLRSAGKPGFFHYMAFDGAGQTARLHGASPGNARHPRTLPAQPAARRFSGGL